MGKRTWITGYVLTSFSLLGGSGEIKLENRTLIERKGDIVFVVDSTGSMRDEIEEVKDTIFDFVDELEERSINYRLALVDFKDYDDSPCGSIGNIEYPSLIHEFSSEDFTGSLSKSVPKPLCFSTKLSIEFFSSGIMV